MANSSSRRVSVVLGLVLTLSVSIAACGRVSATGSAEGPSDRGSTSSTHAASPHARSSASGPPTPLSAPRTSISQDELFFSDVTEADPSLASYEKVHGNVALRALLTDGTAFCALVRRDRTIDQALVDEATGARGTEAQTGLPLSVRTFNTIEAVALLTLCPSEQALLPAADASRIRALGDQLARQSGRASRSG